MNLYSLPLIACATCVETSKNDTSNAAGWSIFFMLGVILLTLGSAVFFIVRIARRSGAALDPEFCDPRDAQPVTVTAAPSPASASISL